MRKKLLLSIGFSLGATALTAVTVGWMGRPQEHALLSPLNESERAQVVESLRAERPGRQRQKMIEQLLTLLEDGDPERLAWHEVQALRGDLERAREQLRLSEMQHSTALGQLRSEYAALRSERDQHLTRVSHLERMVSLLGDQVQEKLSTLDRLRIAASLKETALSESLAQHQAIGAHNAERLAQLKAQLTSNMEALAHQESLTRSSEAALQELRAQHSLLANRHSEASWQLAQLQQEKNTLQKSAWVAQEALGSLRSERSELEHQLAQAKQVQAFQKNDLEQLQLALAESIAARGHLQRDMILAQEAVRQAERLVSIPIAQADDHWLTRFAEHQLELEAAWAESSGPGSGHPVAEALRHALAGMRDVSLKFQETLAKKHELDQAVAEREAHIRTLEENLEHTSAIQRQLKALAQQHVALAANFTPSDSASSNVSLEESPSKEILTPPLSLQNWLTRATHQIEQVEQLPSVGQLHGVDGACSRAACLKAELETLADSAGADWQPLAACCNRWAQEISTLEKTLSLSLQDHQQALEQAYVDHADVLTESTAATSTAEDASASLRQRLAHTRTRLSLAEKEGHEQQEALTALGTSASESQETSLETAERILELEALLAAKGTACQELAQKAENLERLLEERKANLAALSEQVVHLEQIHEQEANELKLVRAANAAQSEEQRNAEILAQRQLADAIAQVAIHVDEASNLKRNLDALSFVHQAEWTALAQLESERDQANAAQTTAIQQTTESLSTQLTTALAEVAQHRAIEASLRNDLEALVAAHQAELDHLAVQGAQKEQAVLGQLSAVNLEKAGLEAQLAAWEQRFTETNLELEARAQEVHRLHAHLAQLENDHKTREDALAALLQSEKNQFQESLAGHASEIETLHGALANERKSLEKLRKDFSLKEESLTQSQAILESLSQEKAHVEGLLQISSLKLTEVLAERDALQGQHKLLSDQAAETHRLLETAVAEKEGLKEALGRLQSLRMDTHLANTRQELQNLKAVLREQEARLEVQSQESLQLQTALADAGKKAAELALEKQQSEIRLQESASALETLRLFADQTEQKRMEMAQRLQAWEEQKLELRLQDALGQLEGLELALADAVHKGRSQAQRLEQLEQLLALRQHEEAGNAVAHRKILDDLYQQIATLQGSVQQKDRELLAEQASKADRIMELEAGLASSEASIAAAKRDAKRFELELAALREANWEGRAHQLEGQSQILAANELRNQEQIQLLERQSAQIRNELASLHQHAEESQKQLRQEAINIRNALTAELERERQHSSTQLSVLQQALNTHQERLAQAESTIAKGEIALQAAQQERAALEVSLTHQINQSWEQRLAAATEELNQARISLAEAQKERSLRVARTEDLEERLRAALYREERVQNELQAQFAERLANVERQAQEERSALQMKVSDLQAALSRTQTAEAQVSQTLEQVQAQLTGTQQKLEQSAAAQNELEKRRHEETQSLRERALGMENRYQQILVSLRGEQDQRLAKVDELQNQVAERDSVLENQLKSLERAHKLVEDTRTQSTHLASRLRELEGQLASSQQQALVATTTVQSLRTALDQRDQQVVSLARETQEKAQLAEQLERTRTELEQQLSLSRQKEQSLTLTQARQLDDAKGEILRLKEMVDALRVQAQDRDGERQEMRSELMAAQEQLSNLSRSRRDLQTSFTEQTMRSEMLQQQVDRLHTMIREAQVSKEDKDHQIALLQRELEHRQVLLNEEDRRHRSLEQALLHERNQVSLLEARLSALSNQDIPKIATVPEQGRFHLVRQGESLRDIAKRYYGDGREAYRVRAANTRVLGERDEPSSGSLLVIP